MKFVLIDRIVSLEPPSRLVATKSLTLAEEYLADHFPTFPVMPGVLMLHTLVEAIVPGFVAQVRRAFARGLLRGYRLEEATLPGVRGRIRCGSGATASARFSRRTRIGASVMLSSTDMCGNRLKLWNTMPISAR